MQKSPGQIRLGIIGLGNMGATHAQTILAGDVPRLELHAACDADPARLAKFPKLKTFTRSEELIRSGEIDAVLIATPHYSHTTIGIDALEHGLHVLVEKPISVHKADCERLIAAHRDKSRVFAAMFNQRTNPAYGKIRHLIRSGELGEIRRVNWVTTDWFRSEAYYASGGWRATWAGEGGGVLLNQCPHQLDLLQWLFGMPTTVRARCAFGRYHDIEVEDDVTALLEYPNGATGIFITSTGEAPGTNRLEIAGERGRLIYDQGEITFHRNEVPMSEFSRTSKSSFATPPVWEVKIPSGGPAGGHTEILRNFAAAILDGQELIAPAAEGIHSVELANAMLFSSFRNETITLPMDAAAYEQHLRQLASRPGKQKNVVPAAANDFTTSFS